jgi:uncharacterized protein YjbI with pentapeptide repeats
MLLLTYIREHNEIPICDDVFKHVLLPFLTIYDLLKSVTTTKQFKKLIQDIIPDHPYNLHNAIWEGPILSYHYYDNRYYINPFILPENPQNYIWVGANLENANLTGANITGANITGADLSYANLSYANLSYANLSYANLRGATLTYSDLQCANLKNANLQCADLRGANLQCANLYRANFTYADIIDANLHCTDLSYSILENTYTNNFNLSMECSETFFISKE